MPTVSHTPFASLLRRYRHAAGLTQEELAERAGLSVRAIMYLERGAHVPYQDTLRRLANALALAPAEQSALQAAARPRPTAVAFAADAPLPAPPTALVGRTTDLAAVAALLARPDLRLVTLTGPGGVGKTRLALAAATAVAAAMDGAVSFIELVALRGPDLVIPTIAQALGLREAGDQPIEQRLAAYARPRRMLLVLDNFEQVSAAAPAIAGLLAACPQLQILVTSREPLHLRGEQLWPVMPLAVPEAGARPTLATLAAVPAVALFLARAREVQPGFALSSATAPDVAAICRRLDGLPLALELAAARLRVLPPADLLIKLERRLPILTGGALDLPERQRTLRAALSWSYDLLHSGEQALFRRLSIFVGGCTPAAAEAICHAGAALEEDLVQWLLGLVDKNLLLRQEDPAGGVRYTMLETLREFGQERLEEAGEGQALARLHAEYFLALATGAAQSGLSEATGPVRVAHEHDNLRAALDWALARREAALAARLAIALRWFWDGHGHVAEGRRYLEAVLALEGLPDALRARALDGAGMAAFRQGDYGRARVVLTEGVALARADQDGEALAYCLTDLGATAMLDGDSPLATVLLQEGLEAARAADDSFCAIMAQGNLGIVAMFDGETALAAARFEQALALTEGTGAVRWRAFTLVLLGVTRLLQGAVEPAAASLVSALRLQQELDDQVFIVYALSGLAGVAAAQAQYPRAAQLLGAADGLNLRVGASVPIAFQVRLGPLVAGVRAALDEAAFTAAHQAGLGLALADALAFALQGIEPTE